MHNGKEVFIIDGNRSPFLRAGRIPGPFKAADLAVATGSALLARQNFSANDIDEVILGCVAPSADETNIARIVSLRMGCGEQTPAWTVARNCASGMQSLDSAATNIALGRSDLILAGGVEAMSHTPLLFSTDFVHWLGQWKQAQKLWDKLKTLSRLRPTQLVPVISLLEGLTDPVCGLSMGQTAEKISRKFDIDRIQMDSYANRSHQRLASAIDRGVFENEIETLFHHNGNSYSQDTGLRRDSSVEKLSGLGPVFDKPAGKVTAGNSAQITDGCSWLILANENAIEKFGLTPRARLVDSEWAGLDPTQMGLGPVHASTPILKRQKKSLADVAYWEINEAFAGQVLACVAAWQSEDYCKNELKLGHIMGTLDQDRLNIDGGGISLGHPVGASGTRIVLHSINVLERNRWNNAIATLCIGGGQGGAMLIERIN